MGDEGLKNVGGKDGGREREEEEGIERKMDKRREGGREREEGKGDKKENKGETEGIG